MVQLERPTLDGSVWMAKIGTPSSDGSFRETYFKWLRETYLGWLSNRDLLWMAKLEIPTLDGFGLHCQL